MRMVVRWLKALASSIIVYLILYSWVGIAVDLTIAAMSFF